MKPSGKLKHMWVIPHNWQQGYKPKRVWLRQNTLGGWLCGNGIQATLYRKGDMAKTEEEINRILYGRILKEISRIEKSKEKYQLLADEYYHKIFENTET